ncbi:MAG TPA: sigma-70 family RNA polymerase sigma factor [Rhodothermales bacterium]|nr:sigma-70 family RNA polymerase sigma factor [Rhodothermales bacterium]
MDERDWLAERFEGHRSHLQGVAYRMLGSLDEADDAVQETWLRLSRSDTSGIENLGGWLATVVARVCLDVLRSRKSRREEPLSARVPEPITAHDPEQEALLADSVGLALLAVLDTLTPPERVAFVLHDLFDLPFGEIAPIVGRSQAAARQLASRARRRVQGANSASGADLSHRREIVEAFLAASRKGDFEALLAVLDPEVLLRADPAAVQIGAAKEVRGAAAVADTFSGRAAAARLALVDGAVGAIWAPGGRPRVAFSFEITHGKIVGIDLVADPERLGRLELRMLDE